MKKKVTKKAVKKVLTHIAYDECDSAWAEIYDGKVSKFIEDRCRAYDEYEVESFNKEVSIYKVTEVPFIVTKGGLDITIEE